MSHTPGPWVALCADVSGVRPIGDDGVRFWEIHEASSDDRYRGGIASVHAAEHIQGITRAERDANARLISAAPELLEALEAVVSVADRKTVEFDKAHAAIAKARGQS